MAWAGVERRRRRRVLPTDMFVLVFLTLGVAGATAASTNDVISVAAFTLVWMTSAMTRLAELRRGERPAISLSRLDLRKTVIFGVGSGTWVVLGVLQSAYASSIVWKPIDVPLVLRALGVVLAVAVIAEPFFHRSRKSPATLQGCRADDPPPHEYGFSAGVMIRSGAILLLSGSPMFALMCALWFGVTLWPPAASAAEGLRLRLAQRQSFSSASEFSGSTGYADRVNAIPAPLT